MSKKKLHEMTLLRPHLVQACRRWILENQLTPYLVVESDEKKHEALQLPHCLKETMNASDPLTLDLSDGAIDGLQMGLNELSFEASFQGNLERISIPWSAVLAIYAKENLEGLFFESPEGRKKLPLNWESNVKKEGSSSPSFQLL